MRAISILLILIFIAGCSTTATIYLKDETTVVGRIERGDYSSIFLDGGKEINRSDIHDIDHPGNSAAIGGLLLAPVIGFLTFGLWMLFPTIYYGIPLGIGSLGWSVWGLVTWSRSKLAAAQPDEPSGPKIIPVTITDGERTYWGLGMSWEW